MSFLDDIWAALRRTTRRRGRPTPSFSSSQRPIGIGIQSRRSYQLPIPEIALRPIADSLDISYDLLEMMTWSQEVRHGLSFLARDCFLDPEGRRGSWNVVPSLETKKPLNADFVAIANDLARRYNGKNLVIGGTRLERAVRESCGLGDSFLELSIEREGLSADDYCISRSLYPPALSVFVDEDDDGTLNGYWQRERMQPGEGDRYLHPVKTLHFCYENRGIYGLPATLQSIEPWRRVKKQAADIEEVARNTGANPWLHVMPEDRGDDYRESYMQEYRDRQQEGIITDLFLLNGADIRRPMQSGSSLDQMIKYWLDCRYEMIVPGIPPYFFPGLGSEQRTGKELANQPAMTYGRLIAAMRSLVGEQLRWAINLEVLLRRGYEFMAENQDYDIAFPVWTAMPVTENQIPKGGDEKDKDEPVVEQVDERGRVRTVSLEEAARLAESRGATPLSMAERMEDLLQSDSPHDAEEIRVLSRTLRNHGGLNGRG